MLTDNFGRKIDYLRISVTDKCNLRCIYCMPEAGIINKPQPEILTFEEIIRIVKTASSLGMSKIRLTGGEPLVRRGIVELVKSLSGIAGIKDISMTTNGILLKEYAGKLKAAGLGRLNISLDSFDQERYRFTTRGGDLEKVKQGIDEAAKAGFSLLKINVLLLDDINKDEIASFLALTIEERLHIRFLEFMPVNSAIFINREGVSGKEVLQIADKFGPFAETGLYGSGPAQTFRFKNGLGTFGLIAPISDKFCSHCNRLRLTSDGCLMGCLHSDLKVNLRDPLRQGISEEELIQLIKSAADTKPKEHSLDQNVSRFPEYSMCQIGG